MSHASSRHTFPESPDPLPLHTQATQILETSASSATGTGAGDDGFTFTDADTAATAAAVPPAKTAAQKSKEVSKPKGGKKKGT